MFGIQAKTKEKVDDELSLYEKRRKLEIDEQLSEWRRSQKNRAVEAIVTETEEIRVNAQKLFALAHKSEVDYAMSAAAKDAELARIDSEIARKISLRDQVQSDFESRGLLRDRAAKAEKEKADAVIAEKNSMIDLLKGELKDLRSNYNALLAKTVDALGAAADKEAVTKVVGFGPSSEPKKA